MIGQPPQYRYPKVWVETKWRWRFAEERASEFEIDTDVNGQPVGDPASIPIPDCAANPRLCEPAISAQRAREIAEPVCSADTKLSGMGLGWKSGRLVWA